MATPGGPSPQQIAAMQQQFAAEAARRGMTPEQFAQQQREQLTAEAAKHGVTVEQYVAQMRMRAMAAHQKQVEAQRQGQASTEPSQAAQQQQQQTTQVPVNPSNPPDPKAVAVAQFLQSQNLKPRTCIMDGQRKDMFKGMPTVLGLSMQDDANKDKSSQTCHTRHRIPGLCQSCRKEELPPAPCDGPCFGRKHLQTSPAFASGLTSDQGRSACRPQPWKAQEPRQGALDRENRAAPGNRRDDALRLALRGPTVEAESYGGCRGSRYFCRGAFPSLADVHAPGSMVPECGHDGLAGIVLRHVDFPSDSILRYGVCGATRSVALPEPIRGCWIL